MTRAVAIWTAKIIAVILVVTYVVLTWLGAGS